MTHDENWVRPLLRWFAGHRRALPWRDRPTPYAVLVSEFMLQQTQVATVVPYFGRFMRRFPTLRRLAEAELQDVLKLWAGLGYYARARHLHEAARAIVQRHAGRIPGTAAALRELPGFGPYTAAAVASIAYGEAVPVLDGNVLRVFARWLGLTEPLAATATRRRVLETLERRIPRRAPGDFNQALMELGALVCRPRQPACEGCPLRHGCVARRTGRIASIPARTPRKPRPHYEVVACVIWRRNRVLIAQRRTTDMLGGLWEFPGGKQQPGETVEETARREILEETGLTIAPLKRLGIVEHAYSHFSITLRAVECRPVSGRARALEHAQLKWVPVSALADYPFSGADVPIVNRLREPDRSQE